MKEVIFGLLVAAATAALTVPVAFAGGGNSDNAKACQKGGWQNLARQDGSGFNNQDDCVSYGAHGGVLKQKPADPMPVTEPVFSYDASTCSVTVPYMPGLETRLYGVNGYSQEVPITHDVTITPGTAGQFWIGYTVLPGYVDTNLGAGTWHIDFYNGDDVLDCTA